MPPLLKPHSFGQECVRVCAEVFFLWLFRFELETKLQEMERRKIDDDARRHAEQEKQEEKVQRAHLEKEQAEREAISLRWEKKSSSCHVCFFITTA